MFLCGVYVCLYIHYINVRYIHVYMCVCVYLYLYVHVCFCVYVYVYIVYVHVSVCIQRMCVYDKCPCHRFFYISRVISRVFSRDLANSAPLFVCKRSGTEGHCAANDSTAHKQGFNSRSLSADTQGGFQTPRQDVVLPPPTSSSSRRGERRRMRASR